MWENRCVGPYLKLLNHYDIVIAAHTIWESFQLPLHKLPVIEIKNVPISYCLGRGLIVLKPADMEFLTLAHELVHARGFGSVKNPHNVGFVKNYAVCLDRFSNTYLKTITNRTNAIYFYNEMRRINLL